MVIPFTASAPAPRPPTHVHLSCMPNAGHGVQDNRPGSPSWLCAKDCHCPVGGDIRGEPCTYAHVT
jgi:hypothetical protein